MRVATFRVEDACAAFEEAHVHHAHGGRQPHTVASTPSRGCWGWAGVHRYTTTVAGSPVQWASGPCVLAFQTVTPYQMARW